MSNFSYCPVTWIFCGKKNTIKLEKLPERALRFVYKDYITPYEKLLSQANLLSLSRYRLRFLAIEMYKSVNKLNPKFINDMFDWHNTSYNLRDENRVCQPKFKTYTFGYRSFKYYGAKIWNSLPANLKRYDDFYIFKKKLTEWCNTEEASKLVIF